MQAVALLLLSHGANPDAGTKEGRTPLHEAAGAGHTACVRALLWGRSPACAACGWAMDSAMDSAIVSADSSDGGSALCPDCRLPAADWGSAGGTSASTSLDSLESRMASLSTDDSPAANDCASRVIGRLRRRLPRRRADPTKADARGQTPLHLAASAGHVAAVRKKSECIRSSPPMTLLSSQG